MNAAFADTTLVVFGHGSTQNAESGASVLEHVKRLRGLNLFKEVRPAFWKQEPRLEQVLGEATGYRIVIVPLFISEGYFCEVIVPRTLGLQPEEDSAADFCRVGESHGKSLGYCRPVGTHPGMMEIVLERAREICERFPFPARPTPSQTTLFIAGHGTGQNDQSRAAIDAQVAAIGERHLYAAVHPVFIEEAPRIGEAYGLATTRNIVVVPFFISDGLHVTEDIPVLLGEPKEKVQQRLREGRPTWKNPTERQGKRVWYAASAGSHPKVAEIILDRVRDLES